MGGLPCAKAIIDNGNALQMKLNCTYASIVLNAPRIQPTYEQLDKFVKAANNLAKVAAEIEVYVGEGGTTEGTEESERRKIEHKGEYKKDG